MHLIDFKQDDCFLNNRLPKISFSGYFRTSIGDGPGCLILQCPYPSCFAAVGRVMISQFASKEDDDKYSDYLLRSYVEDNSQVN